VKQEHCEFETLNQEKAYAFIRLADLEGKCVKKVYEIGTDKLFWMTHVAQLYYPTTVMHLPYRPA